MNKRQLKRISSLVVITAGCLMTGTFGDDDVKIKWHGYMGFETNEVVAGRFRGAPKVDHRWGGNTIGNLTADASVTTRARLLLSLEGKWWLGNYPQEIATSAIHQGLENYAAFYLYQAQGIYSVLESETRSLEFSFGIIPYKYNPNARNLGEYLFRSLCYPGIIFNDFNHPVARLSGLRLNFKQNIGILDFDADAFVLSEREVRPFGDLSLAGVIGLDFNKIIDFGVGAQLFHAISVNNNFTTPRADNSGLYAAENPLYDSTGTAIIGYADSSFYTFAGTKLMAHLSIDLLFFLRNGAFGKAIGEGGKIYGEIDVLGLKNYPRNDSLVLPGGQISRGQNPYGYDTLLNKMPLSFGVNVPVPFLLDVCAVEFEYYRMRYPNNYTNVFDYNRPLPYSYIDDFSVAGYPNNTYSESDNWKWSVYMKKNISSNFHIVAQFARDHQRWSVPGFVWDKYSDWEDISVRPSYWIWNLRGEVAF
ncbi:MAG: hypothetical protein JXA71_15755 [Chitinispirillaceae bacterium]|nr:hypothetical protein [Chitinispirillaceae bacterium]